MKELHKKVLIVSGIKEIGNNEISIKELMDYITSTTYKLRKNNYAVEKITELDILYFFKMYPVLGKCMNGKIAIEKKDYTLKIINNHFLNDLSDDIKKILRIEIKYNIPIVFENAIVVYSVFSQERLNNSLYYDESNNAFLISFKDIPYNEFFNNILEDSNRIKKSTLKIDEMIEFKSKIDSLIDSKYDNIQYVFKLDINKNKLGEYSDYIDNYYTISKENTDYLEENNKTKSLLSTLKRKIK